MKPISIILLIVTLLSLTTAVFFTFNGIEKQAISSITQSNLFNTAQAKSIATAVLNAIMKSIYIIIMTVFVLKMTIELFKSEKSSSTFSKMKVGDKLKILFIGEVPISAIYEYSRKLCLKDKLQNIYMYIDFNGNLLANDIFSGDCNARVNDINTGINMLANNSEILYDVKPNDVVVYHKDYIKNEDTVVSTDIINRTFTTQSGLIFKLNGVCVNSNLMHMSNILIARKQNN